MNTQTHPARAATDVVGDLRHHLSLCQEILTVVERENQALRSTDSFAAFEFCQARKRLLPRLAESVVALYRHRLALQQTEPGRRFSDGEGSTLLRHNQDLILKILLLDRENEQTLLRRGLLPATHLPSVNRQRPHFVAELYRRQTAP